MLLSLPFTYRASILPSSRHRVLRDRWLRGYTDVLIPELSSEDMKPAIEFMEPSPGVSRIATCYLHEGRLFRPARRLSGGSLFKAREFEEEVCKGGHQLVDLPQPEATRIDFDHRLFPTDAIRWSVACVEVASYGPLTWPTLESWAEAERWPRPREQVSSRDCGRAWAQSHYPTAFAIVDGIMYAECPEPVWHVQTYGVPRPRVVLEPMPSLLSADLLFRLDQPERALAFARHIGGDGRGTAATRRTHLIEPSAVERVDALHLARSSMGSLRRLALPSLLDDLDVQPNEDVFAVLKTVETEGFQVRQCDVPAMLDAMEGALALAVEWHRFNEMRGDWRRVWNVVRRWRFEKELGLDVTVFDEFSKEDLAAIEGWEFDC